MPTSHNNVSSISRSIDLLNHIEESNLAKIQETIGGILANPIQSGYLIKFSQSEFNDENLNYLLEVDHFKDLYKDNSIWPDDESYDIIDDKIPNFGLVIKTENDLVFENGNSHEWPSKKINFLVFKEQAKSIWNKFLSSSSQNQICMPARVLSNTIYRLHHLHLYGPKVFDETLIDPFKTLSTTVVPRFLVSTYFQNMSKRLEKLFPLPTKDQLQIRPPSKGTGKWDEASVTIENLREVTQYDLFHDGTLYEEFLKYSKTVFSEENVYLMRAIYVFKQYFDCEDVDLLVLGKIPPEAEDQAWKIFRFFIIPGSAFFVGGLSDLNRKDIMRKLSHPEPDMFISVEKAIYRLLRDQYNSYSFTKEFTELPSKLLTEVINQRLKDHDKKRAENQSKKWTFFGLRNLFKSSSYKNGSKYKHNDPKLKNSRL